MDFETSYWTNNTLAGRLRYQSHPCTTFEISLPANVSQVPKGITRSDVQLCQWLDSLPAKPPTDYSLRLIVAPRVSTRSDEALQTVPFTKATFDRVMSELHLPRTLIHALCLTELHLHYSYVLSSSATNPEWKGFVLRTAPDYLKQGDIAIAIAFNPNNGITTALLLGWTAPPGGSDPIEEFFKFSKASIGHPQLLLALVAHLQLKRFIEQDGDMEIALDTTLTEAGLSRRTGPGTRQNPMVNAPTGSATVFYNDLTKTVLQRYTEAGFLSQAMLQFEKQLSRIVCSMCDIAGPPTPEQSRIRYREEHSKVIKAHFERTREKMIDLADSNRRAADRASLLMSSIWNLIAQEESQLSREIATQGTQIAERGTELAKRSEALAGQAKDLATLSSYIAKDTRRIAVDTKQDSTSMKAIAALTMIFLPFTFVASLFAMPILNWQADATKGQSVLTKRTRHYFHLYWAASIPLTALVVIAWILWILHSKKKQKEEEDRYQAELDARLAARPLSQTGQPVAQGGQLINRSGQVPGQAGLHLGAQNPSQVTQSLGQTSQRPLQGQQSRLLTNQSSQTAQPPTVLPKTTHGGPPAAQGTLAQVFQPSTSVLRPLSGAQSLQSTSASSGIQLSQLGNPTGRRPLQSVTQSTPQPPSSAQLGQATQATQTAQHSQATPLRTRGP